MTTINKDKYKFEKYNPIYKILFQKEKAKLIKIFPKSQIEHVGSTSVPDLGGKGIIDIAISAPKNQINNSIKLLEKNGFEYKIKPLDKKRKFLQKIKIFNKKQRSKRRIRQNKKKAVKIAKGHSQKYRDYKHKILVKLNKKALEKAKIKQS